MPDLFGRVCSITIETVKIETTGDADKANLRVAFEVGRGNKKDANFAKVAIYNLAPETRQLVQKKGARAVIEVGYTGQTAVIFKGKLDYGITRRDGVDRVSMFSATDGGQEIATKRASVSFKAGTPTVNLLQTLAESMGLGMGNVKEKIAEGVKRGSIRDILKGFAFEGPAFDKVSEIAQRLGYQVSIQDEQIIMLAPGEALSNQAILLSPITGLIGSPEPGEKGAIKVKAQLQADLVFPGRKFNLQASGVQGFYRIDKTHAVGDTWGPDWYVDIEGSPLQS